MAHYLRTFHGFFVRGENRLFRRDSQGFYRDSFFFSAGYFLPKIFGILLLPLITRLVETADFGVFSIFTSLTSIFPTLLTCMGFVCIQRYYFERRDDFREFLGGSLILAATLNAIFLTQFVIFRGFWARLLSVEPLVFGCVLAASFFMGYLQIYLHIISARRHSRRYFFVITLGQIIYIVAVPLMLKSRWIGPRHGLIYANMLAVIIVAAGAMVALAREARFAVRLEHTRYYLRMGLPMLPGAVAMFALNYFDRLLIGHYNMSDAGSYSFAYQIAMVITLISGGLFSAYTPHFFDRRRQEDFPTIQALFNRNIRLMMVCAIALVIGGRLLAAIFAGRRYHGALPIIPWIAGGYCVFSLYQYFSLYLSFRRRFFFLQSCALTLSGLLNVGLNVIFVPRFGYQAAAVNTFVAFSFVALVEWSIVRFLLRETVVRLTHFWIWMSVFILISVVAVKMMYG